MKGVPVWERPRGPACERPRVPVWERPRVPVWERPRVPVWERPRVPVWERPRVPVWERPRVPVWERPCAIHRSFDGVSTAAGAASRAAAHMAWRRMGIDAPGIRCGPNAATRLPRAPVRPPRREGAGGAPAERRSGASAPSGPTIPDRTGRSFRASATPERSSRARSCAAGRSR